MTGGGGQKPEPPPVFVFAAVFFISFFFVLFLETSHDNKLHSQTEAQTSADALAATSMGKKSRRDRAGNRDPTMHPTKGLQEAARRQHPDALRCPTRSAGGMPWDRALVLLVPRGLVSR